RRFLVALRLHRHAERVARHEIARIDLQRFVRRRDGFVVLALRLARDRGPRPRRAGARSIGFAGERRERGLGLRECAATEQLSRDEDAELRRITETFARSRQNFVGLGLALQAEKALDETGPALD